MSRRGGELRLLPGGDMCTRGECQADGLVVMAMDSLDRDSDTNVSGGPSVSVFVDLDEANGTGGETGCEIEYGPRIDTDSPPLCRRLTRTRTGTDPPR
jgi:hypothetical protein